MRLQAWANLYGIHRITAYRMYAEGRLPDGIKAEKVGRIIYVILPEERKPVVGYARVSSSDRKSGLDAQVSRLRRYAGENGLDMSRVETEIASGLNDNRKRLNAILADEDTRFVLVEHRDRLARFGVNMVDSTLRARGGGVIVIDDEEVEDDLACDMMEILTSFFARLYGKRSARRRAEKALEAAGDV